MAYVIYECSGMISYLPCLLCAVCRTVAVYTIALSTVMGLPFSQVDAGSHHGGSSVAGG